MYLPRTIVGVRPAIGTAGHSIVELLAALAIVGLLMLAVGPAYRAWMDERRLANHAHFLASTLTQTRSEAIKRGYRVNLCKSTDGVQCAGSGGWETGWIMFADENRTGAIDGGESVLRLAGPAGDGISVTGNRPVEDYVSYTSLGHARLLSGALQMGTFVVCKPGLDALRVVLAETGRARIEKTRERCA